MGEWEAPYRRVLHGWNFPAGTLVEGPGGLGIGGPDKPPETLPNPSEVDA